MHRPAGRNRIRGFQGRWAERFRAPLRWPHEVSVAASQARPDPDRRNLELAPGRNPGKDQSQEWHDLPARQTARARHVLEFQRGASGQVERPGFTCGLPNCSDRKRRAYTSGSEPADSGECLGKLGIGDQRRRWSCRKRFVWIVKIWIVKIWKIPPNLRQVRAIFPLLS